jgi:Fic family protein
MELKETLDKINRLSEELERLRPLSAENEQKVMQKFRLDWNYNSNNLEGNTLTYGETKALLLFSITAQGKPLKDHKEIEGHNEAIDYIIKVARLQEPLTEAMIRELHKMILREPYEIEAITADGQPTRKRVEIGKYKSLPNHVKTITGEIFRFATPEETPAMMEELMTWYKNNLKNRKIHPLMFAAEFHYRFIRIHPFDDGNGRIVRILMNLLLMQKGLPPVIVKTKDKENYYRALQQADSGQLEVFFNYIGEQLFNSLELMVKAAKDEDIEEDDDVDKEIALLQKKLETVGKEELKVGKNRDNLLRVYKKTIAHLSYEFFEKFSKFKKMYENETFGVGNGNITNFWNSKEEYNKAIYRLFEEGGLLNELHIICQLENLKTPGFTNISNNIEIRIWFKEYSYNIRIGMANWEVEKTYNEFLSTKEINSVVNKALKNSIEYLNAKIDREKAAKKKQ